MSEVNKFTARFPSECARCPNEIEEGDEAGYIDDEVCCGDCVQAAEAEEQEEIDGSEWFSEHRDAP